MNRHEIVLAGSGGQGMVLAGILLAEAAIAEGRNVVQTQSYGIATRGGLSLAEVIVDDDEIIFQQVRRPDCVLALTEEAVRKYQAWPARGVPLFYDSTLADARDGANFIGRPFTRQASDAGSPASVNVLGLATVAVATGVVSLAALESVLRQRFKGKALDANLALLAIGGALAVRS